MALQFFQILSKLQLTIAIILLLFVGYIYTDFSAHLLKQEKIYQRGESKRKEKKFRKRFETCYYYYYRLLRLFREKDAQAVNCIYQVRIIDDAEITEAR